MTDIQTGFANEVADWDEDSILNGSQADVVFLAREPRRAAKDLGETLKAPVQYERAW